MANAPGWTDIVQALGQAAGAVGTLAALIFLALQVRSQSRAMQDQRESSAISLKALTDQIQYQAQQAGSVAEQTKLQAKQTNILAQQIELVAASNQSILYYSLVQGMQEISKIFLEKPRLRPYFYENVPTPTAGDEMAEVAVLSEMYVDFMSSALNSNALLNDDQRDAWARYFKFIGENSPGVREYWRANNEWYEKPVRAILDPIVSALR